LLSGQYDIPAIHAEVDAVYTNTTPVDTIGRRTTGGDPRSNG
jgi:CO/xanthine dehydrogenase Mo-binding subunit